MFKEQNNQILNLDKRHEGLQSKLDAPTLKQLNDSSEIESEKSLDYIKKAKLYNNWRTVEHVENELNKFDPKKISLYTFENSDKTKFKGLDLKAKFSNLPVANAEVLEYLLANQESIPEDWKGKNIVFWGTIYKDVDDQSFARFLYWDGSKWQAGHTCLNFDGFNGDKYFIALME